MFLELGSPRYMCSIAPLSPLSLDRAVLHELWQCFSQLCTLSRRGSASLSLLCSFSGQTVLPADAAVPFYPCTLSRWGSPAHMHPSGPASIALLHLLEQPLGKGTPCMPALAPSSFCRLAREYGWSSHLLPLSRDM